VASLVLIRAGDIVRADPSGRSLVIETVEGAKTRLFTFPLGGGAEHEIIPDGSAPLAGSSAIWGRTAVYWCPCLRRIPTKPARDFGPFHLGLEKKSGGSRVQGGQPRQRHQIHFRWKNDSQYRDRRPR